MASAYATLGMELSDEARSAMHRYMVDRRKKSGPRHIHAAEGFGLRPEAIRERFDGYCQRFDL